MTIEHKFTHGKRTFASQEALDLYAASRAAKRDQPSWPLWWKILLWVTGIWLSLYFLGGGKTTPTAPVEERYSGISEDSKSKAALLINLNGQLCAKVTDISRISGDLYRVTCTRYRDGTGSATYEMNAAAGTVK
ncbi:MAG: hypothetical protein GZ093_17405 [Rhodoferax sp.]|uniref:hypothetical protein n=1 Tax=Rhodoferax sp. TaxID=50421 RepID=UPI001401A29B|nr:hypothetical protein [Rhodoferax sp.]NDP40490.1 hypothetical protein [Rhodoferax sp.]